MNWIVCCVMNQHTRPMAVHNARSSYVVSVISRRERGNINLKGKPTCVLYVLKRIQWKLVFWWTTRLIIKRLSVLRSVGRGSGEGISTSMFARFSPLNLAITWAGARIKLYLRRKKENLRCWISLKKLNYLRILKKRQRKKWSQKLKLFSNF